MSSSEFRHYANVIIIIIIIINIICCFPTFPAGRTVALDDPECLFQLVAVSEQVKQTLSVVGTVAQVYNDISGRDTVVAVRCLEPACRHSFGTFIAFFCVRTYNNNNILLSFILKKLICFYCYHQQTEHAWTSSEPIYYTVTRSEIILHIKTIKHAVYS